MFLYSYENLSIISKTQSGKDYVERVKNAYEKEFENKPITAIPYSYVKEFYKSGDNL